MRRRRLYEGGRAATGSGRKPLAQGEVPIASVGRRHSKMAPTTSAQGRWTSCHRGGVRLGAPEAGPLLTYNYARSPRPDVSAPSGPQPPMGPSAPRLPCCSRLGLPGCVQELWITAVRQFNPPI